METTETIAAGTSPHGPMITSSTVCKRNMETIVEFYTLFQKNKPAFYSLWCIDDPQVVTPFVADNVAVCQVAIRTGWTAVKTFWDPIFDEMQGRFDWFIDEFIPGEDPDIIVTRARSVVDVRAGDTWGNKHIAYSARYLHVFRFLDGKVKSFEGYYDTALLNSKYGT
jgi:hypothetical protein